MIEPDNPRCNPLSKARASRTMMVILGAMFTFLAIAYSTTRAATQGSSLGTNQSGSIHLDTEQGEDHSLITNEPSERRRMRAEALQAAVDAGYFHHAQNLTNFIDHFQPLRSRSQMMKTVFIEILVRRILLIEMMNEELYNINIQPFISYSSWLHVIQHVY